MNRQVHVSTIYTWLTCAGFCSNEPFSIEILQFGEHSALWLRRTLSAGYLVIGPQMSTKLAAASSWKERSSARSRILMWNCGSTTCWSRAIFIFTFIVSEVCIQWEHGFWFEIYPTEVWLALDYAFKILNSQHDAACCQIGRLILKVWKHWTDDITFKLVIWITGTLVQGLLTSCCALEVTIIKVLLVGYSHYVVCHYLVEMMLLTKVHLTFQILTDELMMDPNHNLVC